MPGLKAIKYLMHKNKNIYCVVFPGLLFFYFFLSSCVVKQPEETNKVLMIYKSSNIVGYDGKPIIVDISFVPHMNKINSYAKQNNVTIYVTSSFRKKNQRLTDVIVPPAKKSNHHVGHAIDMNVLFDNVLYESKNMYKDQWSNLPMNVKNFLNKVRTDPSLQWGGDFKPEDPVHIDDRLLQVNPDLWEELYLAYQ